MQNPSWQPYHNQGVMHGSVASFLHFRIICPPYNAITKNLIICEERTIHNQLHFYMSQEFIFKSSHLSAVYQKGWKSTVCLPLLFILLPAERKRFMSRCKENKANNRRVKSCPSYVEGGCQCHKLNVILVDIGKLRKVGFLIRCLTDENVPKFHIDRATKVYSKRARWMGQPPRGFENLIQFFMNWQEFIQQLFTSESFSKDYLIR